MYMSRHVPTLFRKRERSVAAGNSQQDRQQDRRYDGQPFLYQLPFL